MRRWLMLLFLVGWISAEEEKAEPLPGVDEVITEQVKNLPLPGRPPMPNGVTMAITADSAEVQRHVQDGLSCLQTGWDFEAYRHFCAALSEDPDCLMAHWGVVISLIQGDLASRGHQGAALQRMMALVEEGVGTDVEKRYAFALVKLLGGSPGEAASAFANLADEYPNDPQARLLECLLGRGGYDDRGEITPDQERAEKLLDELAAKWPGLIYLEYARLAIRAEAPSLHKHLPAARALARLAPRMPTVLHLLGHYEWRCGHFAQAQEAFQQAADLYGQWMRQTKTTAVDCPGWTKAECYRAVAMASADDYEKALGVAKSVADIEVSLDAAGTRGGRLLLWEGKTLPIRILMRRDGAGDMKRARDFLPAKELVEQYGHKSLVVWSYQAYSALLSGRLLIEQGEQAEAFQVLANLTQLGEHFVKTRQAAQGAGERSEWLRFFKSLEVMVSELRGLRVMGEPEGKRATAFNWYSSARDRQTIATLMMPPSVLLPMESRLGEYYLARGEWPEAVEVLEAGLEEWPRDSKLLERLIQAYEKAGDEDKARRAEEELKAVLGG